MQKSSTLKAIHALAVHEPKGRLESFHYETKPLGPWDIEVQITHCGICHSDIHLIDNDWNFSSYPLVPGHEIVGIVKAKGDLAEFKVGDRVGIGWQKNSCHTCPTCRHGEENLCLKTEATCVGNFGGFADCIQTDSRFAFLIPNTLASEYAAPLLCAGATVFSPLLHYNVNATWQVGVFGIGGLGHLALQFLKAFGCEVFAFSSSKNKEKEAKEFGAHHFIDISNKKGLEKYLGSFNLILLTSTAPFSFEAIVSLLAPRGILCVLGGLEHKIDVLGMSLVQGNRVIAGSGIGSPADIHTMLQFASTHDIKPKIELFSMSEANEAIKKVKANRIHYRAVLKNT